MEHIRNLESYQRQQRRAKYMRMIESGRDFLSEWHMEILFTLCEQDTKELAAAELEITADELEAELKKISNERGSKERQTNEGKPYKKRLSKSAFIGILADKPDLTDEEQAMIRAMIKAPNQTVAAMSLGMTLSTFEKRHMAMRRAHDF